MGNCYAISGKTVSPQAEYGGKNREDVMNGCVGVEEGNVIMNVGNPGNEVSCSRVASNLSTLDPTLKFEFEELSKSGLQSHSSPRSDNVRTRLVSNLKKTKTPREEIGKKNKEDGSMCNKSGVVRIRVVVTKEELKQILNNQGKDLKGSMSVEELVSELKLRRQRRRKADEEIARINDGASSWKPILESIPEDH